MNGYQETRIAYHRRRVVRNRYGVIARIAPRVTGALAQCRHCTWGKFVQDRARTRYSAMARAAASLRAHVKCSHPEVSSKLWIPDKEEGNDAKTS